MAKEAAAALAKGETLDEKSSSDEDNESQDQQQQQQDKRRAEQNRPLRDPNISGLLYFEPEDDDRGNEADMDDTSMSSRASSRMMDESGLYDSELDTNVRHVDSDCYADEEDELDEEAADDANDANVILDKVGVADGGVMDESFTKSFNEAIAKKSS